LTYAFGKLSIPCPESSSAKNSKSNDKMDAFPANRMDKFEFTSNLSALVANIFIGFGKIRRCVGAQFSGNSAGQVFAAIGIIDSGFGSWSFERP